MQVTSIHLRIELNSQPNAPKPVRTSPSWVLSHHVGVYRLSHLAHLEIRHSVCPYAPIHVAHTSKSNLVNLISYVGTLKAIDSDTATVSLEHVTCSGTEGRKGDPEQEIPGSDMIYDGIVFRGSDVKDLTIIAPPKENRPPQMPNDPAILQVSELPILLPHDLIR